MLTIESLDDDPMNVPAEHARLAIQQLLVSRGLSFEHGKDVADTLVETSLLGIDTHGVRLLPTYLRELEDGRANAQPQFRLSGKFQATAVLHADNALGVVAANAAMREAIERAARLGIAAVAVADSNHFGAAGHYARMAARKNQIGMVFSNSDALVRPAAGSVALNGSNPIAVAAPGMGDDGFFLDMATSEFAYSRLMQTLHEGSPNASRVLAPLGGYKGQGLGTMVQILCAVLTRMPFDADLSHLYTEPFTTPRQIGHLMLAIELEAFVDPDEFRARVSQLLTAFRESPQTQDETVMNAGDREQAIRRRRLFDGIPLAEKEYALLAPHLSMATQ